MDLGFLAFLQVFRLPLWDIWGMRQGERKGLSPLGHPPSPVHRAKPPPIGGLATPLILGGTQEWIWGSWLSQRFLCMFRFGSSCPASVLEIRDEGKKGKAYWKALIYSPGSPAQRWCTASPSTGLFLLRLFLECLCVFFHPAARQPETGCKENLGSSHLGKVLVSGHWPPPPWEAFQGGLGGEAAVIWAFSFWQCYVNALNQQNF